MKSIEIIPLNQTLNTEISIPGSKSYTNRAFLIASLAKGKSTIINPLLSDDTIYMQKALKKLGASILKTNNTYIIKGVNSFYSKPKKRINLYLGNAGTAVRFLSAVMATQKFPSRISGNKRMKQRPISDLLTGITQLGGVCKSEKNNECPPILISKKIKGGKCIIKGNKSSQYFSALMIAAPCINEDMKIIVDGDLISKPYIDQTIYMMKKFGVEINNQSYKELLIKKNQYYKGGEIKIEGDASSSTYFGAIAALTQSQITIKNIGKNSIQADINFFNVIKKMGAKVDMQKDQIIVQGNKELKALGSIDLNHMPDGAMTVAILCAFAKGKSQLTGLKNLRIKETDRLNALKNELQKIGCNCKETKDGLIINGNPKNLHGAEIETYHDHRMAMCFAVTACRIPNIKILDPKCSSKTYPNFWKDLKKIGIKFK